MARDIEVTEVEPAVAAWAAVAALAVVKAVVRAEKPNVVDEVKEEVREADHRWKGKQRGLV